MSDRPIAATAAPHLPLWKVGALGLAYMLIGPSMAMSAGALIGFSAQAAWLSNLLSVIVLVLLSIVISAYARRYVVTGSLVSPMRLWGRARDCWWQRA